MKRSKFCQKQLKKLLTRLKNDCEKVAVILQTGDKCCRHKGCICRVGQEFASLIIDNSNCSRKYIPLDCICAVIVLCEDENNGDNNEEEICKEEANNEKSNNNCDEEELSLKTEADNCQLEAEEKEIIEEESEIENNRKIYGYGRKIKINFFNQTSELEIREVAAVELSLNVSDENESNLIQYFHRNQTDNRNIGVSVLPSGPGNIDSIEVNESSDQAVISGRGLIYINSEPKSEEEFLLTVTNEEVSIEFNYQEKKFAFGPEELIGVGRQQPIIIEQRN